MAKNSREYWADRAAKLEKRANDKGEALAKKLKREYAKANREIQQKIEAFYGRYATEQGLSYAEAVKRLNSAEAREWRRTLGEYVDEINSLPDGKEKAKLLAELDARSYASQQDRLSQLAAQIDMEIDRLFATGEQQMTLTMTDVLEDGYYRKSFDLQQRAGVLSPLARLSTNMIEDALTYPWSGADFSTRIWENKRALLFNARQTITQGIIQGQSVARMSNALADSLGKSYKVAERLIRTETNHFHAEADKLAYSAAGVEEYEFMATLDNRTSEVCANLDGKHFKVKDAKPGTNYPPMHPNCRSTTVEYDPEDAADWAASGQPMPENLTYAEWKKRQDRGADIDITEGGKYTVLDFDDKHAYEAYIRPEYNAQRMTHADNSVLWAADGGYIQNAEGYKDINSYMRGLKPSLDNPKCQKTIDVLVDRTSRPALKHDYIGFRKVSPSYLHDVVGLDTSGLIKSPGTPWEKFTDEDAAKKLAAAINELVGTEKAILTDKAVTSVSLCEKLNFFKHRPVKFEIQMPTGTKGLITRNYDESEFIAPPKTELEILGAKVYNDGAKSCICIFAKMIQP